MLHHPFLFGEIPTQATSSSDEIDDFPDSFDWLVKASLDGDRIETSSVVASDRAPDDGYLRVDG